MPPDEEQPGQAQEERVRTYLINLGYIQPYGTTDDEVRRNLSIKGKCADFVGYHSQSDRWLIAESKGGNMDIAFAQLKNTARGLLVREPEANGKLDLHIYTDKRNYTLLTETEAGLGGHKLGDGLLGYNDEQRVWHYSNVDGVMISVLKEQGT